MKKTLIEFFDEENLKNCISQLFYKYNKAYYFCFPSQMKVYDIEPIRDALEKFNKQQGIENEFIELESENPEDILSVIDEIITESDEVDFDITGGPEPFSFLVGKYVSEKRPENIRVHCFDFNRKTFLMTYPLVKDIMPEFRKKLKANELIKLQASLISNDQITGGKKYRPDLTKDNYINNIKTLWKCVKDKPVDWNNFCSLGNENKSGDKRTNASLKGDIRKCFEAEKAAGYIKLLRKIEKSGLITIKDIDNQGVTYRINLPDDQLRIFNKGGDILEMYSYYITVSTRRFFDCCVGVNLDWDGKIENKPEEINNEVDLILSNNYCPFFVSCKNTEVEKETLYEIATISRYYGGLYAKPVIFSSVKARDTIKDRAEKSEIVLIDNIAKMTEEEFRKEIRNKL